MRYLIQHETLLEFPAAVREHHIELRLTPREDDHQRLISRVVETEPPAPLGGYTDYYGNRVEYFCVIPSHDKLVTRITSEVETLRHNPFDFPPVSLAEGQEWLRVKLRSEPSLYDYLLHRSLVTPDAVKLSEMLDCSLPRQDESVPLLDSLISLMAWVPSVLSYQSGATDVHANLLDAVKNGAGVCQDFAHLFIVVARWWGVPARYVMGYLDPGVLHGEESAATHAWAEALVPGGGWIGFDSTQNLLANDHYVPVAIGRDSYDAAPQRGSFKGDFSGGPPKVHISMLQQNQ